MGLRGHFVDPASGSSRSPKTASFGAYSDNYSEYLLKTFLQSGRSAELAYSRKPWLNAAREVREKLVQPVEYGQYVSSLRAGKPQRDM